MKKTIQYIITGVAIAGVLTLTAVQLSSNKQELADKVYRPDVNTKAIIQAEQVKESEFLQKTPFLGSFSPNHEVTISTETSGKVIAVNINEGSQVNAGTVVARLDDGVLQAQLRSAEASFANAANTLKRYQEAPEGVTKLQMDDANTNKLTSKAQIDQLRKQISQYKIKAPFSGIITKKSTELGAIVSPGTALANLIDIDNIKLEISVPEQYISKFKNGTVLNVKTEVYPDAVFKGKVDMVGSQADASHNYTVKILVNNNDKTPLRAGMYGNVVMDNSATSKGISIARSALIGSAEKPQVYVVENGKVKIRNIQIGADNERNVQVIAGLKENEMVATGGLVNLFDGAPVEIK